MNKINQSQTNKMNTLPTAIFSVVLALCSVGCITISSSPASGPVVELDCDDIGSIVSTAGDEKFKLELSNSHNRIVDVFWINYNGEEELKTSILPGGTWATNTYITHPWVVREKSGACVALYNSYSRV